MSNSILTADVFSSAAVAFLKDPHTLCISAIILRGNKIPQNEPYIWITGNRSCFSFSLGGADSEDVQMQIICGLKKILFDCGSTEILLSSVTWEGVPLYWISAQTDCRVLQIITVGLIFSPTAWPSAVNNKRRHEIIICWFSLLFDSIKTNSSTAELGDETVAKENTNVFLPSAINTLFLPLPLHVIVQPVK